MVYSSIHFIAGCFLVSSSQVPACTKAGVVGTDIVVNVEREAYGIKELTWSAYMSFK
jgi:hypothetical protein